MNSFLIISRENWKKDLFSLSKKCSVNNWEKLWTDSEIMVIADARHAFPRAFVTRASA